MEYDNEGKGALFRAKERKTDKHPEYTGSCQIEGVEYWLSAWVNVSKADEKYFSIKFKPKDAPKDQPVMDRGQSGRDTGGNLDDEIPF